MSTEFIFVYGTLRQETVTSMSQHLRQQCDFISTGQLQAQLFEVDGYPGAIISESANDKVIGDVYRGQHSFLQQLDRYEECSDDFAPPHDYIRQLHSVILTNGDSVSAWVYIFNRDVSNLFHIQSGDYLAFLNSSIK
ncbi:MAG: gamma-glutamylcyclotransferase [Gammaproteobacteria bacterium]|nr:gamma-glutamylcyclotransferase [Gammaproteobacteria bacterium]